MTAAVRRPLCLALGLSLAVDLACSGTMPTAATVLAHVRAILLSPTALTLAIGETKTITATVTADAGADKTLAWSTSDANIAKVDQAGAVTGIAGGTASIVATSKADPGVSATAAITVPAALDLTPNYGNFNITATKTTDTGCAFVATFAGQVNINGNKDGTALAIRMIERLTRIYAGTMQSDGRYSGTGTGNLDGFTYNGSIAGAVSANSLTGTETLNFTTGCPGKQVVYQYSGNR